MDATVLIIGGGIAGISAAARLAPHCTVLLLEAEDALAHHASSRSAALYEPRYGAPAVVELSLASEGYFRDMPDILSPRGLLMVARAQDNAAFLSEYPALGLQEIPVAEAKARVPMLDMQVIARAAYSDLAWDIDTDLLLQGFARTARSHGAQIQTRSRVMAIDPEGQGWRVTTQSASYRADIIVNAAGAWVDQIARLAGVVPLGFTPYRRSMARIPAPEGQDSRRWPMIFGAGESWYCKPDAGALLVSPAEEDLMEPHDAWADDLVLAEGLARYEAFVTEPVTRLLASWAGLRTFSPDRSLVVGFDAVVPGFFWLAGQGGQGFQSCPATSQLAADLILGRKPAQDAALIAALSPGRFGR
jgi:D-arginine dehydrogenase